MASKKAPSTAAVAPAPSALPVPAYSLPAALEARLQAFCAELGLDPGEVIQRGVEALTSEGAKRGALGRMARGKAWYAEHPERWGQGR